MILFRQTLQYYEEINMYYVMRIAVVVNLHFDEALLQVLPVFNVRIQDAILFWYYS